MSDDTSQMNADILSASQSATWAAASAVAAAAASAEAIQLPKTLAEALETPQPQWRADSQAAIDAANAAATSLQSAIQSFGAFWLEAHSPPPTRDNNGDPLTVGAEY